MYQALAMYITPTLESGGDESPYPLCGLIMWRLHGLCNGHRLLLQGRLPLLSCGERCAAVAVVESWPAPVGPGIGLKRAGSLLPRVGPLVRPALHCV